jgi:SRSO17 transposase
MQARELERSEKRLEGFLAKLTAGLGRSERRRWAGVYVRGLLLDGERKSVEPMAARLGESDQDLQHFVSQSPWLADALLEGLAKTTATTPPTYWVIDETSFPKAGSHSAGVQRQYCGALGKKANCQLAVSLHRADEATGTSQPLSWRLFLPEGWTDDAVRCQRAGIPPGIVHQSKLDLALGRIDQALDWQLPPGVVLADEAYGGSFEWRLALRERGLFYCVRVPWTTTGWQEKPRFGPPAPVRRGFRARRGPLLSPEPKHLLSVAQALPASAWKRVTWRQGTKGPQRSRFAALSLWAAHGWKQGPQPERIEEVALIEWPEGEPAPTRYWLARLPKKPALKKLVAMAKARWHVEQDYRELKDELGLDHFEGRSWQGFHHHAALVTAAFVFLRQEQGRLHRHAQKKPAAAHPAAGAPLPASRAHPSERPLPVVSHPLPVA